MKGSRAKVGDTRVSKNGYHYTKTELGWELTHRLVAEKHIIKRKLAKNERVSFIDGDKTNLKPENIRVSISAANNTERRKAQIRARIESLEAELAELEAEDD